MDSDFQGVVFAIEIARVEAERVTGAGLSNAFGKSGIEVIAMVVGYATGSLGDLPLAVLSHDPDKPSADLPADLAKPTNDAWEKMQEELGHLSTRGTQVIAKNSSHYIQIDRPDVVIDAVRNVVQQARRPQSAGQPSAF